MSRASWCAVVLAALAAPAVAVVGGAPAAPPEPDSAVVFVQKHSLSARVEGIKNPNLGYYSFYGIRYAEPPVGIRRFQRPQRRLLAGEIMATRNCWPCPQPDPRNTSRVIGSEDCLCLNVFAPKMPGEEQGSPVVFFIHGGNYRSGSNSAYGGQHLTQKDTILVTAQYRLGSLGYLSTGEKDASGNAGLFDLRAAMTWITDYIEFFGGDPSRIVVMGQGSGGSAASLMALSNEGRSATGVAALSGTPLSPGAVRPEPGSHARELANKTNCPEKPAESLLICLRQLPVEKIILADNNMNVDMVDTKQFLEDISGRSGAGARVEGQDDMRALPPLVEYQPSESLEQKQQKVPLLTGVTSAETSNAVFGKYNQFLKGQLSSVKDFIKEDLVGGLRDTVQGVQGLVPSPLASAVGQVLPLADYYSTFFENSLNAIEGLSQIVEATGDALFNLPAYQTVKLWSSGSPAYLYSFEHSGNLSKGSHFLPGMALTDALEKTDAEGREAADARGPAHGDELAYIFEPLDKEGNTVEKDDISSTDAKVRDNFVGLISKFAHDLTPMATNNKSGGLRPFSKDNEQFIKITDTITLDKDFRFCQIGLWGNMADRISGAFCKTFLGNILKLPINPSLPLDGKLPITAPKLPVTPNLLPGFLGQSKKTTVPASVMQVKTTRKPSAWPFDL